MHFATKLNSRDIQKCNKLLFLSILLWSVHLFSQSSFSRANGGRPAFTDWETSGCLCFFSWSRIMATTRPIMCNCNWWEGIWGRSNLLPKSPKTVHSEPKFGPPPPPHQKFLDPPLYWRGIRWGGCICRLNYLWINM